MFRKVVVEFDAPSIKRCDSGYCIARGDQANEDWRNANKYNGHWGVISGLSAPDIFKNVVPMAL